MGGGCDEGYETCDFSFLRTARTYVGRYGVDDLQRKTCRWAAEKSALVVGQKSGPALPVQLASEKLRFVGDEIEHH